MFKKILLIIVLAALGYLGYMVWKHNLSEEEKSTVKNEIGEVGGKINNKTKELAKQATEKVKEVIRGKP